MINQVTASNCFTVSIFRGNETLWWSLRLLIALCTELEELSCPLHAGADYERILRSSQDLQQQVGEQQSKQPFCPHPSTFVWHLGRMQRAFFSQLRSLPWLWVPDSFNLRTEYRNIKTYKQCMHRAHISKITHCAAWLNAVKIMCMCARKEGDLGWIKLNFLLTSSSQPEK